MVYISLPHATDFGYNMKPKILVILNRIKSFSLHIFFDPLIYHSVFIQTTSYVTCQKATYHNYRAPCSSNGTHRYIHRQRRPLSHER